MDKLSKNDVKHLEELSENDIKQELSDSNSSLFDLWNVIISKNFLPQLYNMWISASFQAIYHIWKVPPLAPWIKVNIDGSSKGNLGLGSCFGVYGDSSARLIGVFGAPLGICDFFFTKMKATLLAITFAFRYGWRWLWLETDSWIHGGLSSQGRRRHRLAEKLSSLTSLFTSGRVGKSVINLLDLSRGRRLKVEKISRDELYKYWSQITDQSFDYRLQIFFDMYASSASCYESNIEALVVYENLCNSHMAKSRDRSQPPHEIGTPRGVNDTGVTNTSGAGADLPSRTSPSIGPDITTSTSAAPSISLYAFRKLVEIGRIVMKRGSDPKRETIVKVTLKVDPLSCAKFHLLQPS
ncbi:hypothetical protein Dsin_027777 [Dipteronia sinensis]|uniref:RNase H type-1 domain-containing protein n=1 Tax=Dipteronia sinensis TaxID=43782 RepID=A0AAE0DTW6_9ROSI|nr:hypothetical protein Dsin_027777 [Dipteronia sinensis]